MRRILFVTTIAVAFAALTPKLHAADLTPRYKAPGYNNAPDYFNWTGFYVGLNAGYATGSSNVTSVLSTQPGGNLSGCPACVTAFNGAAAGSVSPKGFTGGLTLGYNLQFGSFVAGLEGDIDALMLKGSRTGTGSPGGYIVAVNQEVKTDWLATVRPRIGYAFDRFLVYGTAGVAASSIKYTTSENDNIGSAGSSSASKLKVGWTAGLGLEYAWFSAWSVKAEYLYVNLGSVSSTNDFTNIIPPATIANSADLKANIFRIGANYRF
jgi:outer membrane immunogenic protein